MVTLTINGQSVQIEASATILDAAKSVGVEIPTLCYWKGLNQIGACRVCVVEVAGYDRLLPACETIVEEGMEVRTHSPCVVQARKTNVQLILSEHNTSCTSCVRSGNCELQRLADELNITRIPYEKRLERNAIDQISPLVREADKCVKCMRCIQVCDNIQTVNIWSFLGIGSGATVGTTENKPLSQTDCTYCGQCVTHCPVGALTARDDTDRVIEALADPNLTTLVQVAPAVRAAWQEEFGIDSDAATPQRLAALLRRLGFDYVFDTNFGADLTIMEEASEFIERFTHKDEYQWPMFTSCCPGWMRFVKTQYPEFVANTSTAKSPQQMFGAIAKSYFAERMGLDPHNIRVVSIMPCMAKKRECEIETLRDACGDPDVDLVLTTRELTRLVKALGVAPDTLQDEEFDSPLGEGTGAATIFGATGGVMDAALRTAYYLLTGANPDPDAFEDVRGSNPWKETVVKAPGDINVRVAVVSGLGSARKLLDALKRGDVEYDFVEVMACPGGCAGGGGQPIHEREEYGEPRANALWKLDANMSARFSHENRSVMTLYDEYLEKPLSENSHRLLHVDQLAWNVRSDS